MNINIHVIEGAIVTIVALIASINFHEAGHWLAARGLGFKAPIFSLGLPIGPYKRLFTIWETEVRIGLVMLGGYVSIPDMDYDAAPTPIWKRAIVAFAGPFFNVLLAFAIVLTLFATVGVPRDRVTIQSVNKASRASEAGLKTGDRILSVGGTPVSSSEQTIEILSSHKETCLPLTIERSGKSQIVTATPNTEGRLGMTIAPMSDGTYRQCSLSEAAAKSTTFVVDTSGWIYRGLAMLVRVQPVPAGLPKESADLHGVVAVGQVMTAVYQHGLYDFAKLVAAININLAVINLLPIPALDGGHLLFLAIEKVLGKPAPKKWVAPVSNICFYGLLLLGVLAIANDIIHPLNLGL